MNKKFPSKIRSIAHARPDDEKKDTSGKESRSPLLSTMPSRRGKDPFPSDKAGPRPSVALTSTNDVTKRKPRPAY